MNTRKFLTREEADAEWNKMKNRVSAVLLDTLTDEAVEYIDRLHPDLAAEARKEWGAEESPGSQLYWSYVSGVSSRLLAQWISDNWYPTGHLPSVIDAITQTQEAMKDG